MEVDLIIPKPGAREQTDEDKTFKLTWTTDHPMSSYGLGVLLYLDGDVLDGFNFRALRDHCGAFIVTDDPDKVRQALGVPIREPGIFQVGGSQP